MVLHHWIWLSLLPMLALWSALEAQPGNWTSGSQWFNDLLASYQKGEYKDFLQQVDNIYREGLGKGEWQTLQEREKQAGARIQQEKEQKNNPAMERFQKELSTLQNKTNQELLSIAAEYPQAGVSSMIKESLNLPDPTAEQKKALDTIFDWQFPSDNPSEDPFITKLRAIATEYKMKKIILFQALGGFGNILGLEPENAEQYFNTLNIDEFTKMLQLARQAGKKDIEAQIQTAMDAYRLTVAKQHDFRYISSLGNDSIPPSNEAENKVARVMRSFEEQRIQLMKKNGIEPPRPPGSEGPRNRKSQP